jgi:uncharacterized membrane protein YedE/YeeE
MNIIMSLIAGFIFSIGLIISEMVNPDKVIGFLDIFGEWDYSLAFVMGGAVILNLITFKFLKLKDGPIFSDKFEWPKGDLINARLIIGSSLFGIGWGLIGICPGPGIVNLATLEPRIIAFVLSMIVGMLVFKYTNKGDC